LRFDLKELPESNTKHDFTKQYKFYRRQKREWETTLLFQMAQTQSNRKRDETREDLMTHGLSVQADTKASLDRIQAVIADSRAVAVDTANQLDKQNKQLVESIDDLASIDTTLVRSRKILSRMGRKLATDKCLCALILLVIIFVLVIIIVKYKN
jgi:preprotein translocase subunit SecF